jgi:hypothetical protein
MLAALAVTADSQSGNRFTPQVIDGRVNPELIPEHLAWEHFFSIVVDVVYEKGDEPIPERVDALASLNLGVSYTEALAIARMARATLTKASALREPLDSEHSGRASLGWTVTQREERLKEIRDALLHGRDDLKKSLSGKAFRALRGYIEVSIIPGMKVLNPGQI